MAEIVNLRRARKQRARCQAAEEAAQNRARFGEPPAARNARQAEEDRRAALLDGHRTDREADR